jgi:hypothetical protein
MADKIEINGETIVLNDEKLHKYYPEIFDCPGLDELSLLQAQNVALLMYLAEKRGSGKHDETIKSAGKGTVNIVTNKVTEVKDTEEFFNKLRETIEKIESPE